MVTVPRVHKKLCRRGNDQLSSLWAREKVCQGNLREGVAWSRCLRMKGRFTCKMDPVFLVTDPDSWYNSLNEGKRPSGSVDVNVICHYSRRGESDGAWPGDWQHLIMRGLECLCFCFKEKNLAQPKYLNLWTHRRREQRLLKDMDEYA